MIGVSVTSSRHVGAPSKYNTWRLHTKLYKFERDTFPSNAQMKDHTDLNLGEAVYISIISQVLDFPDLLHG